MPMRCRDVGAVVVRGNDVGDGAYDAVLGALEVRKWDGTRVVVVVVAFSFGIVPLIQVEFVSSVLVVVLLVVIVVVVLVRDGTKEGHAVGTREGRVDGAREGYAEGSSVGTREGASEGYPEGSLEGSYDGPVEGTDDGGTVGRSVGTTPVFKVLVWLLLLLFHHGMDCRLASSPSPPAPLVSHARVPKIAKAMAKRKIPKLAPTTSLIHSGPRCKYDGNNHPFPPQPMPQPFFDCCGAGDDDGDGDGSSDEDGPLWCGIVVVVVVIVVVIRSSSSVVVGGVARLAEIPTTDIFSRGNNNTCGGGGAC